MIQSFRHKGLKRLFEKGEAKGVMKGLWAVTVRANWGATGAQSGEAPSIKSIGFPPRSPLKESGQFVLLLSHPTGTAASISRVVSTA